MSFSLKPISVIEAKLGIQPKGPVHSFFTATCAKHCDRYVPYREGKLAETVVYDGRPTKNVEVDRFTYMQPYARYVYKGITKNGNQMNYTKDRNPEAGPNWDKRMWSSWKDIIVKEVQDYMEGKNGRT